MTCFVRLRAMCTFYFGIMTTFRWPLIRSRIHEREENEDANINNNTYGRIVPSRSTPFVCSFASSIKMIHATETNKRFAKSPFKPGEIMKLALAVDVDHVETQLAWLFVCATIWRPNLTERTLKRKKRTLELEPKHRAVIAFCRIVRYWTTTIWTARESNSTL